MGPLLLTLLGLSCAAFSMSPEREASLGAEAAQQVEQEIGLVRDAELEAYVSQIGQRMVGALPDPLFPYRFHVADMLEPNAFALPGGYIYVSRGLLAIANSETELANVIGHEIGHVVKRHAAQRQGRATGVGLFSVLATVATAILAGGEAAQVVGQLSQVAGAGLIASYSREQEHESDVVGQQLAAATGFDPQGMPAFLRTLEGETLLRTGAQRRPGFLDSHPVTAERVQNTTARARELEVAALPGVASSREAFLAVIEGIVVGPDPAQGIFRDERFLHPGLDFTLTFPQGWQQLNQATRVGAVASDGGAFVMLELQGGDASPEAAAQRFARENSLSLSDPSALRVGSYDAFRAQSSARTQQGDMGLELVWIAHPSGIFRVTGAAPLQSFRTHADAFFQTAASFRGLSGDEHASITIQQLQIATARRGESLEELSRRTRNRWSVEQTEVANALARPIRFAGGEKLKIAVERPYRAP